MSTISYLLFLCTSFVFSQQYPPHQQPYSPHPTPFYSSQVYHQPTVITPNRNPSSSQPHSPHVVVSAYHTTNAHQPALTTQHQQQQRRNPYPTQTSYRAPQRRTNQRGHNNNSNHVPILARSAPTRPAPILSPAERQRQEQIKSDQERRRIDELQHIQRKNAEKLRLDEQRRRQSEEKKRAEQDRKHRESIEAAERQRVEQARLKADEERKRAEDEQKRRNDEELRRKAAENERQRLQQQSQQQHIQAHPIQVADPRNHYSTVPLTAPQSLTQPSANSYNNCDIPPDLWCDSRESSIACGVEHQCSRLRRRPIKITLIYEALCPFCQRFISNQLGIVFNQLRGHFDLELVPWGNSRLLPDGSFSCNHGQKECDANRLQSCVLDQLQVKGALPFIVCFEKNIFSNTVDNAWRSCSAFVRSHEREIRHCYETEKGVQLQRIAAQKTLSARPQPIVEVPYLLINDYSPNTENNDLNVMLFPQLLGKWAKMFNRK